MLPDGLDAEIHYPDGRSFAPDFAPEPISVYEGEIEIAVELEEAASLEAIDVHYQACDEARCLAPTREHVALEAAGDGS